MGARVYMYQLHVTWLAVLPPRPSANNRCCSQRVSLARFVCLLRSGYLLGFDQKTLAKSAS